MQEGQPKGEDFFEGLRGQLSEKVDGEGQPDSGGEPRKMSANAFQEGHKPLPTTDEINAEADRAAAERAKLEETRHEINEAA